MAKANILQICSKQCRITEHGACHGSWEGFGFEISCDCICHTNKNRMLESECPRINNVEKLNPHSGQNENTELTHYNNTQIKEGLEQQVSNQGVLTPRARINHYTNNGMLLHD